MQQRENSSDPSPLLFSEKKQMHGKIHICDGHDLSYSWPTAKVHI